MPPGPGATDPTGEFLSGIPVRISVPSACARPGCVSLLLLLQARGGMTAARARRGARGLGPDDPPRRRGAGRRGRPDLRGARPARRDPPGRRLPDPADRHDDRGGGRPVPVRAPGTRRRARARARSSPSPGSRSSRPCPPSCAAGRAGCSSASTSTPRAGSVPASRCPTWRRSPSACGTASGSSSTTSRGDTFVTRTLDPLGLVLKAGDWYLVARPRRPAADVPGVAGAGRRADSRSGPTGRSGFDLGAYWIRVDRRLRARAPRIEVTLRVRRDARPAGSRTSSTRRSLVSGDELVGPRPGRLAAAPR